MKPVRRSIVMSCSMVLLVCTTQVVISAQNQKTLPKTKSALDRIPVAKMEEIRRIRTGEDWPNPIVIVNDNNFYLISYIDGRRVQAELTLVELEKELAELGIDRWPLGRVVAVQENGLRSPGENETISGKRNEVEHMFELYKVMVELWPSG